MQLLRNVAQHSMQPWRLAGCITSVKWRGESSWRLGSGSWRNQLFSSAIMAAANMAAARLWRLMAKAMAAYLKAMAMARQWLAAAGGKYPASVGSVKT